jgi:hypothetical protein
MIAIEGKRLAIKNVSSGEGKRVLFRGYPGCETGCEGACTGRQCISQSGWEAGACRVVRDSGPDGIRIVCHGWG